MPTLPNNAKTRRRVRASGTNSGSFSLTRARTQTQNQGGDGDDRRRLQAGHDDMARRARRLLLDRACWTHSQRNEGSRGFPARELKSSFLRPSSARSGERANSCTSRMEKAKSSVNARERARRCTVRRPSYWTPAACSVPVRRFTWILRKRTARRVLSVTSGRAGHAASPSLYLCLSFCHGGLRPTRKIREWVLGDGHCHRRPNLSPGWQRWSSG
jgi:hypothetical protein